MERQSDRRGACSQLDGGNQLQHGTAENSSSGPRQSSEQRDHVSIESSCGIEIRLTSFHFVDNGAGVGFGRSSICSFLNGL